MFSKNNSFSLINCNVGFEIHDIYKIDELSDDVMNVKYGEWNKDTGLVVNHTNIWKRRSNFLGYNIE